MGKKKKTAEHAAEQTQHPKPTHIPPAAATPPVKSRQEIRSELSARKQENVYRWCSVLAGVVLFLLTCLGTGESAKPVALLAMLTGISVLVWKRRVIGPRFGVAALLLTAYCVMITVSSFYAPAGKFALTESIKFISALAVFFVVLGFEPNQKAGQYSAMAVELSAALIGLVSIDLASAELISSPITAILSKLTGQYTDLAGLSTGYRIISLFGNVNIYAGVMGLGVLMSLGLLSAEGNRRARRFHLVCLCVNAIGFVISLSRGAMGILALAFIAYLFLERGEARGRALVLMVESLLFAGAASLACIATTFGTEDGMHFVPLGATLLCTAGLILCDELIGVRIADKLVTHTKAVTVSVLGVLGAAAIFVVAALNLTGSAALHSGEVLYRTARPAAGALTLHVEADGEVYVGVDYQPDLNSYSGTVVRLYDGVADGATFTVPEDSELVLFYFTTSDEATITDIRYEGAKDGALKLRYLLLPEGIASRLQGVFQQESFQLRRVLWHDGLNLWKTSPMVGLGIGAFENKIVGIQRFHYETKYVHNHYIQSLIDTGLIGLILFAGTLLACAVSIALARRKENSNPMLPALGACLLFMAGQAYTDVIFSSAYYLPSAFIVFALIVVCSGGALSLTGKEQGKTLLPYFGLALLAVWVVLLGLNLYAGSMLSNPTYKSISKAAKFDRYERNDYLLSYVYSACIDENRTPEITAQMFEYMAELEKAPSNTIPYYLGYVYFNLGDTENAFDMLEQYTSYLASSEKAWNAAFQLASGHYEDTEAYINGITSLYQNMLDWNAQNLKPIVLEDGIHQFITFVTGME